jgi:hypothetical protein
MEEDKTLKNPRDGNPLVAGVGVTPFIFLGGHVTGRASVASENIELRLRRPAGDPYGWRGSSGKPLDPSPGRWLSDGRREIEKRTTNLREDEQTD